MLFKIRCFEGLGSRVAADFEMTGCRGERLRVQVAHRNLPFKRRDGFMRESIITTVELDVWKTASKQLF